MHIKKAKWITVFLLMQAMLLFVGCANSTAQEAESNGSLFPAGADTVQLQPKEEPPSAPPTEEGGWDLIKMTHETGTGESLEIFVETEFNGDHACIMRFLESADADKAAQTFELAWRPDSQLLKFAISGPTDPPITIAYEYTYDEEGHISQMELSNGQSNQEQSFQFRHLHDMDGRLCGTNVEDENGNTIQNILYVPLDHGGTLQMDLTTDFSTGVSFVEYDSDGRPLRQTLYTLNEGITQASGLTMFDYDQAGNLAEVITYDETGNVVTRILLEYEQNADAPAIFPVWEVLMNLSA